MTPTPAQALDLVVAHTGHARYRDLLDPAHPSYDPSFWPVVLGMAAGFSGLPAPPPPGPPPGPRRTRRTVAVERVNTVGVLCRSCASGCGKAVCHAGRGDEAGNVSMADCFRCLGVGA